MVPCRNEIVVSVDCTGFERVVDETRLMQLCAYTLAEEQVRVSSIGIVLTNHERVRSMNVAYLGHDFNTDVLSFLIDETNQGIEGEVYVDLETARERCAEFGAPVEEEIARYMIHGLLHLAGHDDDTDQKRAEMRRLEDRYLKQGQDPVRPSSSDV